MVDNNRCNFYIIERETDLYLYNPCDDLLQKLCKLNCKNFNPESFKYFQFARDGMGYCLHLTDMGGLVSYDCKNEMYQDFINLMNEYGYKRIEDIDLDKCEGEKEPTDGSILADLLKYGIYIRE